MIALIEYPLKPYNILTHELVLILARSLKKTLVSDSSGMISFKVAYNPFKWETLLLHKLRRFPDNI